MTLLVKRILIKYTGLMSLMTNGWKAKTFIPVSQNERTIQNKIRPR